MSPQATATSPWPRRETTIDVSGQEIMTADKVTLRMNAVVTYRVIDARKSVEGVVDADQALYREAQQALRAEIGTRELDALLADKDVVAKALSTEPNNLGPDGTKKMLVDGIEGVKVLFGK